MNDESRMMLRPGPGRFFFHHSSFIIHHFLPVFALLAVFVVGRTSQAEDRLSWSLTETLLLEWHGEADMPQPSPQAAHDRDNYLVLKNRANLGLRRGPLDVTVRFDQSTYWNTCPEMPDAEPDQDDILGCRSPRDGAHESDYQLERVTARLSLGRHRLYAGDFPVQVGRGIALSLRKVSEFGIDDALRGARVQLRLHDAVGLDLFGGVLNVNNIDEVTDAPVPDPRDRIVGGQLEGRILDVANVTAHGVLVFPLSADGLVAEDSYGGEWTGIVGGTLELPELFDRLSVFVEGDGLIRTLAEGGEQEGFALYSAIDLDLGRVTLLGELKWYEGFRVMGTLTEGVGPEGEATARPLSLPPTIEREDQNILNNWDVLGGRLRADVRLARDFLLYTNAAYVHGRDDNLVDTFHVFGGLEYRLARGRVNGTLSGGYRREFDREGENADVDWDRVTTTLYHLELNVTAQVVGRHGLHLAFRHETWNKPSGSDDHTFHRGTLSLGYDLGSTLSVSVAYEYDTTTDLNEYTINDENCQPWLVATEVRRHFGFAEVRYQPLRWLDLRLRGGTMRGGLRCLSGVCRMFPNFTGVRLEAVVRF